VEVRIDSWRAHHLQKCPPMGRTGRPGRLVLNEAGLQAKRNVTIALPRGNRINKIVPIEFLGSDCGASERTGDDLAHPATPFVRCRTTASANPFHLNYVVLIWQLAARDHHASLLSSQLGTCDSWIAQFGLPLGLIRKTLFLETLL
jgi:hypothetical protein